MLKHVIKYHTRVTDIQNGHLFKLALWTLSPNENTCQSPQSLKKIYAMCSYAIHGIEIKNDTNTFKIKNEEKVSNYSSFILKKGINVNKNFTKYNVSYNDKTTNVELLKRINKIVYKTEEYKETPINLLHRIFENHIDEHAIIFSSLNLNIPWYRYYKWEEKQIFFNGYENRNGMVTTAATRNIKIGIWKKSNVVIKIPCNINDQNSIVTLTILIPNVKIEEIYKDKTFGNMMVKSNDDNMMKLDYLSTSLESLKSEILEYTTNDIKKLIEKYDYLQDCDFNTQISMPIIDVSSPNYSIKKIDFKNAKFSNGANIFGPLKFLSDAVIQLKEILCCTRTKICPYGLSVEGIAMGLCFNGRNKDKKILDIKFPFMFIVSTDINNIYSIGFVNK